MEASVSSISNVYKPNDHHGFVWYPVSSAPAKELKVCESCSGYFIREYAVEIGENNKPFRVGPTICDRCVVKGQQQVMSREVKFEQEARQAVRETVQKYRRSGAEHPTNGKIHRRHGRSLSTRQMELVLAMVKEKVQVTAKDINTVMHYTNPSVAANRACRLLGLVVVGFMKVAGDRRPRCLYGFRTEGYKAPSY